MEFPELVKKRRSIRAFEAREVEAEKILRVLEAARAAPSAGNLQAYEILVVREPAAKSALSAAALHQTFIKEAPVVLVFFQNPTRSGRTYGARGREFYSVQDATISCAYAQLQATAEGLATCWVGAYDDDRVNAVLAAPKGLTPIAILPVGYGAERPPATDRRRLEDLVKWDTF
jgi:nitroreductase